MPRNPFVHEFHEFPKQVYNPMTAEMIVAKSATDVPQGWIDHYPTEDERDAANKPDPDKASPLSRDQLIAALKEGGISFKANASTKDLEGLLAESLRAVLVKRGAQVAINTTVVDLLYAVGSKVV